MKKKITRATLGDVRGDKTNWARVDALTDADIARAISEDPDTFNLPRDWLKNAVILRPARAKKPVTVRLDEDMLKWFKKQGRGYQTRINAILRSYYEAAKTA
jgi:uncharacterized protein (DUF4415 family)